MTTPKVRGKVVLRMSQLDMVALTFSLKLAREALATEAATMLANQHDDQDQAVGDFLVAMDRTDDLRRRLNKAWAAQASAEGNSPGPVPADLVCIQR